MSDIAGIIERLAGQVHVNGMVQTLRSLRTLAEEHAFLAPFSDKIDTLAADFDRMGGFFVKGVSDSERGHVYETLCHNTLRVARNMQMAALCTEKQAFSAAYKRAAGMDISELPQALEQYAAQHTAVTVGELPAGTSPETTDAGQGKEDDAFYNRVFSVVLASSQWTSAACEQMCEAICQPAINNDVSAMLVSAVMLSAMAVCDMEKMRCLEKVYARARCEEVRQRAFVGLVLLLAQANCNAGAADGAGEEWQTVSARLVAGGEESVAELLSLQKQALRQLETPQITDEVEKRLLPGIMDIVKDAKPIVQKAEGDDSSLEDIIDNELNERIGEKIHEKVELLMKYKTEGIDVDYHTFRRMSLCGFFHTLSHWFVPFSIEHPDLVPLKQTLGKHMPFFDMVCRNNGFCNIDAYNFLISIYNTLGKSGILRKSMEKVSLPADLLAMGQDVEVTCETIRTAYLRDLYRFFTLSPMKDDFVNPFVPIARCANRVMVAFLGCPAFAGSLFDGLRLSAGRFCAKKKWYTYISDLDPDETYKNSEEGRLLVALYAMHCHADYAQAIRLLTPIAMLNPGKHAVVKLLAQCCRRAGSYDDALQWYRRLPKEQTATLAVKYQMVRCQLLGGHEKEAVNGAYELDFLYPGNPRYMELLMQVLSQAGQHAKAQEKARELALWHEEHADSPDIEERVNVAVCHWLAGDTAEAFRQLEAGAVGDKSHTVSLLAGAKPVLLRHGVSLADYYIMYDMVTSVSEKH